MISFYVSSFTKIQSPIRKINIHQFLRVLLPPSPQMVESGKKLLSSLFVHVPDTPTKFHRPSTSRSIELAKALKISPNSPKKSGSGSVISITYLGRVLLLPTNSQPNFSTLSVFQYFPFPPSAPSNITRICQDLK